MPTIIGSRVYYTEEYDYKDIQEVLDNAILNAKRTILKKLDETLEEFMTVEVNEEKMEISFKLGVLEKGELFNTLAPTEEKYFYEKSDS